jgi:hypothetical protein
MAAMSDAHDHRPDAFDHLLDEAKATAEPGNPDLEVTFAVPLSAETLSGLTERAHREGRDVAEIVAEALRVAAA